MKELPAAASRSALPSIIATSALGGLLGGSLAAAVVISLFASYAVAMTVVPLFCAMFIKGHHQQPVPGVELEAREEEAAMEGHAVKPRRITADFWRDARQCRRARCEERIVPGVRHHTVFGLRQQPVIHILGMARMRKDFVGITAPELDRRLDAGKSFPRK